MPERHPTEVEVWKPIPLTDGWYEASSLGRIRCAEKHLFVAGMLKSHTKARVLKVRQNRRTGYPNVSVRTDARRQWTPSVHKLVADAFRGPRPELADINHIDGNRRNSRPENLEYVTRSENHFHAYRKNGRKVLTPIRYDDAYRFQVKERAKAIRSMYAEGRLTQEQVAERFGVGRSYVCQIINGRKCFN